MPTVSISKSTTITLGVAIMVGGIITWAAHVDAQVQTNTKAIEDHYRQSIEQISKLSEQLTTTNSNLVTTNNSVLVLNQLLKDKLGVQ